MKPRLDAARRLLRRMMNGRPYENLVEIRVSRSDILHNLAVFKKQNPGVRVAPVLKSNAYGHGLAEVGTMLDKEQLPFFCVDSFFEALMLRNEGVRSPILVIGYTPLENILQNRLADIAFCIIGIDELEEAVQKIKKPTKIHLKVDTGMHRHGIMPEEIEKAAVLIRSNTYIELEGIYSHLADADTPDSPHTKTQIERWNAAVRQFRTAFPGIRYFHCAATAGSVYLPEMEGNVMRLGIGLYGIDTTSKKLGLRPALELHTSIASLRTVLSGESVGYNATFKAGRDIVVASIPAGYNEGVDRRLSNKGFVLVRGTPCPIVGRVSMNITSIDVSSVTGTKTKEPVVIVSKDPRAPNSVEKIAATCGTIPYEILVHIPAHLRRVVV